MPLTRRATLKKAFSGSLARRGDRAWCSLEVSVGLCVLRAVGAVSCGYHNDFPWCVLVA